MVASKETIQNNGISIMTYKYQHHSLTYYHKGMLHYYIHTTSLLFTTSMACQASTSHSGQLCKNHLTIKLVF